MIRRLGSRIWQIGPWAVSWRSVLRANFVGAVWATALIGALLIWADWAHGPPSGIFFGRYSPTVGAAVFGFAFGVGEIMLWFYQFKDDDDGNGTAAMLAGCIILLPVLETVISDAANDVHDRSYVLVWILSYLALAHIIYGLHCWS